MENAKKRNVEEDSRKSVKRQRVSRACDQCRNAREKCDGGANPRCQTCEVSNRPCTYTANPKKRGIQPGYIRSLELSLAWIFADDPSKEEALREVIQTDIGVQGLITGKDSKGSCRLHKRWRKSLVRKRLETLLSSPENPVIDERGSISSEVESESENAPFIPILTPASQDRKTSLLHHSRIDRSDGNHLPETDFPTRTSIPRRLPADIWHLLDVYFAFTHPWFPISERKEVLKLVYSYPSGVDLNHHTGSGEHAELWAMLAISSLHKRFQSPSFSDTDVTSYYSIAHSLIPNEDGPFEPGHVKALLLLALINMGQNKASPALVLVGRAIQIALQLGLDRNCGKDLDSPVKASLPTTFGDHKRAKHILMSCFLLETLLSIQLGSIPHLRREDLSQYSLVAEDGLEELDPWVGVEGYGPVTPSGPREPGKVLSTFNSLLVVAGYMNFVYLRPELRATGFPEIRAKLEALQVRFPLRSDLQGRPASAWAPQEFGIRIAHACSKTFLGYVSEIDSTVSTGDMICTILKGGGIKFPAIVPCLLNIMIKYRWTTQAGLSGYEQLLEQLTDRWRISYPTDFRPTPIDWNQNLSPPIPLSPRSTIISNASWQSIPMDYQTGNVPVWHTGFDHLPSNDGWRRAEPPNSESIDLENLFDEFASLDDVDLTNQPIFMQNLGLAPGIDLTEVQLDPPLTPYV
ncbi:hypothetical protein P152DRAFT_454995 [Eremomyces bilateralis CBS 781.70]|uniref:Zn(2)-C6 fungal-type domain-containing protein n=1 Tax=Eremomyces bilateralis CBS 781.70 TaxID=1392243 RepID=A0A6G1GFC5_9PEZI|nr:uncharacterized protein P152DRAFT_454995 [Eremomyces bilateralis CBS 781.70]KAF1816753.1 hypothetical protein P152DRAFT_454995 [Eremomyces bilateralis CBS 781.70]